MYRGRLIPGNFSDGADAGAVFRKQWISQPRETETKHAGPTCESVAHQPSRSPGQGLREANPRKRIACVLVADFAVAAITRANPELRDRPFALLRMPTTRTPINNSSKPAAYQPHSELSHVSPIARAAGLRPAMTVAQACALIPDLIVTRPSAAAERSAADALLDVAESMSPVAEEGTPGCVWLDLTGVERLYRYSMGAEESASLGGAQCSRAASGAKRNEQTSLRGAPPENVSATCVFNDDVENSIAGELIGRARRIGLEAAAGIGSTKEIAHLAARCGGARVIAAGMEREFLNWLPLDLLELDPNGRGDEVELMLKRLGIRRLGDIARLDSRAIGSRLGRHGVQLARLARGEGSATVIARPRAETFAEAAEFEYGIENLEPLGFVLHAMLTQLTERLQIRGLAAGDLTLSLGLAGHRHDSRHVPVAAATTEARSLLTLLKLHLEKSPPPAAVEAVRLTVEARTRRPAQTDLFLPAAPAPDRLEAAIARIAALCGPERVGTLMPADSYRPEATRLGKFVPPPPPVESAERRLSRHAAAPASDSTPIVLRAIRPAEEVEVMCTRNSPEFVRGVNICARVVSAAGPWRRQGEWWAAAQSSEDSAAGALPNNSAAYNRDYYELALADGAVYRIYCDLSTGKWFADGIYD
jgi:nucleotidyltransferase/DNA polymerase involved in DNA repair